MKQLFAVLFAVVLVPTFNTYAWIGGPFSNNTYFGEEGDNGVYEAVAIPTAGTQNGIGLFRWGVSNTFSTVPAASINQTTFTAVGGGATDFNVPVSGNIQFGGIAGFNHTWFLEGVTYLGFCFGTVNSGLGGFVSVNGIAMEVTGITGTTNGIASGFTGTILASGAGIPARRFEGDGTGSIQGVANSGFVFFAFGTKVADQVGYFGQLNP